MRGELAGVLPVLPTPFAPDGSPDEGGLVKIVEYCVRAGVDGIVYPANASEVQSLTAAERTRLVGVVSRSLDGRLPLVVGLTGTTTDLAGTMLTRARGAAAAMVMPQAGPHQRIVRELEMVDGGSVPLILQNAAAPLGPGLSPEELARLAAVVPSIRYIKEEVTPSAQRIALLRRTLPATVRGLFGGDGGRSVLSELRQGATGFMPAADLVRQYVMLHALWRRGDLDGAYAVFEEILPFLNLQRVYRWQVTKRLLRWKGVIASDTARSDGSPSLDAIDDDELRRFAHRADEAGQREKATGVGNATS